MQQWSFGPPDFDSKILEPLLLEIMLLHMANTTTILFFEITPFYSLSFVSGRDSFWLIWVTRDLGHHACKKDGGLGLSTSNRVFKVSPSIVIINPCKILDILYRYMSQFIFIGFDERYLYLNGSNSQCLLPYRINYHQYYISLSSSRNYQSL